jgi:predicted metal-dependent HD superfamily phosphohydrolase
MTEDRVHKNLEQRWSDLWRRLGAQSGPEPVWSEIVRAYWQPDRTYHTLVHVQDCLTQFDSVRHLAEREVEVEMALWCHDVVCDPRAVNNEAQSAAWTSRMLKQGGVAAEVSARIEVLILATQHHTLPDQPDGALVVDIDLSILGRTPVEFDRYEAAIRQEYHWVSEPTYREARIKVLESFLARASVFQTQSFRDRYEAQARDNLTRSIRDLH